MIYEDLIKIIENDPNLSKTFTGKAKEVFAGESFKSDKDIIDAIEIIDFGPEEVANLPTDTKLDMCIFYGEQESKRIKSTDWVNIKNLIDETASEAIKFVFTSSMDNKLYELEQFMKKNGLEYTQIISLETYQELYKSLEFVDETIEGGRIKKIKVDDEEVDIYKYYMKFGKEDFKVYFEVID